MGDPSNWNGKLPGQFGIGIAAYYALSDNMFIQSLSRDGGKISYLIRDMKTCDNLISTNPVNLETYGTKIKLNMQKLKPSKQSKYRPEPSNVKLLSNVIEYLKLLSRFSGVDTWLTITEPIDGVESSTGRVKIGPIDPVNFVSEEVAKELTHKDYVKISNEDYDLTAVILNRDMGVRKSKYKAVTLAGMPMEKIPSGFFLEKNARAYCLQVKNERDYKPIASRDSFLDESLERLDERIEDDLINYVGTFNISTIDDYKNLKDGERMILSNIAKLKMKKPKNEKIKTALALAKLMGTHCHKYENGDCRYRLFEEILNSVYDLRNLYCLRIEDTKKIAEHEDKIIVIPPARMFKEVKKYLPNLLNLKSKSTMVKIVTPLTKFNKEEYVDEKEIDESFLRVESGAEYYAAMFREYKITIWKICEGKRGGTSIKDFIKQARKSTYSNIKGSQIIDGKCLVFTDYSAQYIKQGYFQTPHIYMNNYDLDYLQMAALLSNKKIKIKDDEYITNIISKKYGVSFYNSDMGNIIESLNKIKDEKLRKSVARFYSSAIEYDQKVMINDLESNLEKADEKPSHLAKVIYLALHMKKLYNDHWKYVLKNQRKTQENADVITEFFQGYDASWDDEELTFKMQCPFDNVSGMLERMKKIGLVSSMRDVSVDKNMTAEIVLK